MMPAPIRAEVRMSRRERPRWWAASPNQMADESEIPQLPVFHPGNRSIARHSWATAWRRDRLRISPRSQRFGLMSPLGDHDLEVFTRHDHGAVASSVHAHD
jgi:hypothetical protein